MLAATSSSSITKVLLLFLFPWKAISLREGEVYVNETEPQFMSPILNVTIAVGRDAQLPCTVDNLGSFKVAWLRVEDKGILTIHDHVITRNYRINLIHTEEKQFTLLIKNIQPSDAGGYMCQINTVPMKSRVGYVEVVVPPQILVNETSSDVVASEGSNVTLECRASGHPRPQIQWKREDRKDIPLQTPSGKKYVVQNISGESLTILRVARVHMGALLCIASNGIQPSVSRRVFLKVQFPPAVWLPTPSIGSGLGHEVTLSCHIEAFPSSVNYWIKESSGKIIESDNDKYLVQQETKDYKTHLVLTIRRLERTDFGLYSCLAKNSLGSQEGSVKLHEIPTHGRSTSSHHRKRQYKGKHSTETHTSKDSNIKGQFYGETKSLEEDAVEDGSSFTSKTHSSHFLEEDTSLDDSSSSSSSSLSSDSSSTLTRDAMITFSVAVFLLSSSQVSLFSDVSISSLSFLLMSICSMLLHIQLPSTSLISFLSCYCRNISKTWKDYSSGLFFFLFLCCFHDVIWRTTIVILSVLLLLIPRLIQRTRSLHWFFSKLFAL